MRERDTMPALAGESINSGELLSYLTSRVYIYARRYSPMVTLTSELEECVLARLCKIIKVVSTTIMALYSNRVNNPLRSASHPLSTCKHTAIKCKALLFSRPTPTYVIIESIMPISHIYRLDIWSDLRFCPGLIQET